MPRLPSVPRGVIVYDGPSLINGAPIVVVLTSLRGTSSNDKTAGDLPLAQTYVIPRAMVPAPNADQRATHRAWFDALGAGCDAGVCGACPLRPSTVAALKAAGLDAPDPCYVLNGPADVAAAVGRGAYPVATLAEAAAYVRRQLAAGRIAGVRAGSWGDPAAAPPEVHAALFGALHTTVPGGRGPRLRVRHPDGRERPAVWSCYTRTWEYAPAVAAPWRGFSMASAHSPAEARAALARGWRPFTVVDGRSPAAVADAVLLTGEGPSTHCPASVERASDAACSSCGMCDGASRAAVRHGVDLPDPRGAVVIMSHGQANRSEAARCRAVEALARMNEARRARAAARA